MAIEINTVNNDGEDIKCPKCLLINEYRAEYNNSLIYCHCKECGSFIKFLPILDKDEAKFYFGKYKGTRISECTDKNYMEWLLKNNVAKGRTERLVKHRLQDLKNANE